MVDDAEWPDTICRELTLGRGQRPRTPPIALLDFGRFQRVADQHGGRLISSWLHRAWNRRESAESHSFEPFIYSWICLNGWASSVTGLDRDRGWLDALMAGAEISERFVQLASDSTSPLGRFAIAFSEQWPIFKVQEIRDRRTYRWHKGDRRFVVESYLGAGLTQYQPRCWQRHRELGELIPVDWPHTLESLYRVRCNLFHGEKGLESEMDAMIVSAAFRVLVYFLHESGYIISR